MSVSNYSHGLRHKHGYFKPLQNASHFLGKKSFLFVAYKKCDKTIFDLERSKAKQKAVMAAQRSKAGDFGG